jgi:hypothetical protein
MKRAVPAKPRMVYLGRYGFWWFGRRWDIAYWTPWAWKPSWLSIRHHWWGATEIRRQP